MNIQKQAFTLVELIVVITILAILGTIAFISLNGYSKTARDSARTSDLSTMKTSLELFNLDAGKYPNTTDSFNITYSGVTIWTQGEFGNTTTNSVDRLDNIPTDPLTERKYTYSVTKTKQEYQLAGLLEGDDVVLNLIDQTNAGDIEATAIVTGNYNGMMIKTLSGGINCEILAIPSIISNQGTAGVDKLLGDIVTNSGFVYDRKNNLPSNYLSSKYKVDDGFDFTPNQLVVYSDSNSCKPIYNADDATQRTELITNLQTAYTGTILADEGIIAEITTADSGEIESLASVVVNNNLGGSVVISNGGGGGGTYTEILEGTNSSISRTRDKMKNFDFEADITFGSLTTYAYQTVVSQVDGNSGVMLKAVNSAIPQLTFTVNNAYIHLGDSGLFSLEEGVQYNIKITYYEDTKIGSLYIDGALITVIDWTSGLSSNESYFTNLYFGKFIGIHFPFLGTIENIKILDS